jgi:hypothetical protein
VLTVLKAALNHAFREGRVPNEEAWRRAKPFREADAARVRYLSHDEARPLVNATEAGLRQMVQVALLTGCRYGELTAPSLGRFPWRSRHDHDPNRQGREGAPHLDGRQPCDLS